MTPKMRFAPLVRVSTESQEKKGESLLTQKDQIIQHVKNLDGVIPAHCWDYSGQEHATPDNDRKKLDSLLQDASKGLFDAVIVCDASRWSRDNKKSKEGLEILKANNIRFYIGAREIDLFSPEQLLFLGMATEINEFQASTQTQKSILNRINRAKRNVPTSGNLPFGRTFDKSAGKWGIDEDKASKIQSAAKQYLAGNSLVKIAQSLDMNPSNLWKILTKRSGKSWQVQFKNSKLRIDETISIEVPPLLPQGTIDRILEKAAANKTYTHGHLKNRYLLSRMVFCDKCGYAMFGQTNHGNRRYYRHARYRMQSCDCHAWVPADALENGVLAHLFNLFGDKKGMELAIANSFPTLNEISEIDSTLLLSQKAVEKVDVSIAHIVNAISNGTITESEARSKMEALREKKVALLSKIEILQHELKDIPTKKHIHEKACKIHLAVMRSVIDRGYKQPERFSKMPYENKRSLIEQTFSGRNIERKRYGVYVKQTNDPNNPWIFTLKGILSEEIIGHLPFDEAEQNSLLGVFDPATDLLPEDFIGHETKYSWWRPKPCPRPLAMRQRPAPPRQ